MIKQASEVKPGDKVWYGVGVYEVASVVVAGRMVRVTFTSEVAVLFERETFVDIFFK